MALQPDDFINDSNKLTECHPYSLLQANAMARAAEQKMEDCCKNGMAVPMWNEGWNEGVYRIRSRYRENWVHRGSATHCKSPDNIY